MVPGFAQKKVKIFWKLNSGVIVKGEGSNGNLEYYGVI